MKIIKLDIIRIDILLWTLGGFAKPIYLKEGWTEEKNKSLIKFVNENSENGVLYFGSKEELLKLFPNAISIESIFTQITRLRNKNQLPKSKRIGPAPRKNRTQVEIKRTEYNRNWRQNRKNIKNETTKHRS
jgi:hypothetical protein